MLSDLPTNISTYGQDIDGVIRLIWWVVNTWLVAAEVFLIYALIRFRKREGKRAKWMPADTLKASMWVLVPAMLVLLCDLVIEWESAKVWDHVKTELPKHDVLVRVTGRQFAWTFTYAGEDGILDTDDDFRTESEMHVPVDQVVRVQLESVDVLHAFWVPALRFKQDVVPGRSFPGWFEATQEGEFIIACAELCGASHTAMQAGLVVESEEAYRIWSETLVEQQHLAQR